MVIDFYDEIEENPGSKILYAGGGHGMGILQVWEPVLKHMMEQGCVLFWQSTPTGLIFEKPLFETVFGYSFDKLAEAPEYGTQFVYSAYFGMWDLSIFASFGEDYSNVVTTDFFGTPLNTLPMFDELQTGPDYDYLITLGFEQADYAISQWGLQCLAIGEPGDLLSRTYMYEAGIFQGAVFGYRMGLEYEQMSGFLGPNTKAISCTIFAVAFAVGGMIISNIVYFARRASGGG
jgi:hypothetical protein